MIKALTMFFIFVIAELELVTEIPRRQVAYVIGMDLIVVFVILGIIILRIFGKNKGVKGLDKNVEDEDEGVSEEITDVFTKMNSLATIMAKADCKADDSKDESKQRALYMKNMMEIFYAKYHKGE
jgi:hypothetical protein